MRYVIIRDDDTNALTPVSCLEQLYRPFLARGFPVSLATIPEVTLDAHMADGSPEGFLLSGRLTPGTTRAIGSNRQLVEYLIENKGYYIVQHGLNHEFHEFDNRSRTEIAQRLVRGSQLLVEAGFPSPQVFVAPYDRLSAASFREVCRRFRVLSTGWFELRRLPIAYWPFYGFKKLRGAPHWRVGQTVLLTHPGCLLSCHRDYSGMVKRVIASIQARHLTVLVTHWWEYFRNGEPDNQLISLLHQTAEYLGTQTDVRVISFGELLNSRVPLN